MEESTDGESKRESSGVWCADEAGLRAGSMGDAGKRMEATMEVEDGQSIEIRPGDRIEGEGAGKERQDERFRRRAWGCQSNGGMVFCLTLGKTGSHGWPQEEGWARELIARVRCPLRSWRRRPFASGSRNCQVSVQENQVKIQNATKGVTRSLIRPLFPN